MDILARSSLDICMPWPVVSALTLLAVYNFSSVFTHGLLYVALSRVGDPAHIQLCVVPIEGLQGVDKDGKMFTCNIVYEQVLAAS